MATSVQAEHLRHLDGARFLAALWIVCAHFMPLSPHPFLNGAVFRVNVAVCFFVVTSGFVTQWAYGSRSLAGGAALGQFYARRLGRVVFTFWVTMALACFVAALKGTHWSAWYITKCFLFVAQWFQWCPNGPSWFVFAMLPSWLLYPFSRKLVGAAGERGQGSLLLLLCGLWAISFGPAVVLFMVQDGNITWQQHADMMFWPPAQLADFAIGMTAAAMVQEWHRTRAEADEEADDLGEAAGLTRSGDFLGLRPAVLGATADGLILFTLGVVTMVPRAPGTFQLHLNGWEPLMDHGFALVFAGFLAATAAAPGKCQAARLFAFDALASLGERSFEVYLFQRPVHDLFALCSDTESMQVFILFLLILWLLAFCYGRHLQDPVDRWIRLATASWGASPCQTSSQEACRAVGHAALQAWE